MVGTSDIPIDIRDDDRWYHRRHDQRVYTDNRRPPSGVDIVISNGGVNNRRGTDVHIEGVGCVHICIFDWYNIVDDGGYGHGGDDDV